MSADRKRPGRGGVGGGNPIEELWDAPKGEERDGATLPAWGRIHGMEPRVGMEGKRDNVSDRARKPPQNHRTV